MKATGFIRRVAHLGMVVIPADLRKEMGFNIGKEVIFSIDGDQILLNRYEQGCSFCHSTENISFFKGKRICNKCRNELTQV